MCLLLFNVLDVDPKDAGNFSKNNKKIFKNS